jgi:hypothetical protein
MVGAVAGRAVNAFLGHLPFKVLLYNAGSYLLVTVYAGAFCRSHCRAGKEQKNNSDKSR